jgi:CRISPR-associated protein Cas5d
VDRTVRRRTRIGDDVSEVVQMKVWSRRACFTRPEFGAERVSYDVMTPSAARGVLEAVYWKPEIRWHVREISVLRPIKRYSIVRNEINHAQMPNRKEPYYADSMKSPKDGGHGENRAQRSTVMLRDVAYIIRAQIELLDGDNVVKHLDQFRRRVRRRQCFHQPYAGTRECSLYFAPPERGDTPIDLDLDLGWMVLDFDHETRRPLLFDAKLERGVLRVPEAAA